jgi:hypothetical protein
MKYLEGLIEWESNGLKGIPTNLLQEYIVDLQCELENRKKAVEGESNQNMNKIQDLALPKTDVICCGVLERMQLGWMKLEDGTRCMPYIKGHSDENMYRVNNCPSCGKYVRDVMVEP